jgi:hypothetical protein
VAYRGAGFSLTIRNWGKMFSPKSALVIVALGWAIVLSLTSSSIERDRVSTLTDRDLVPNIDDPEPSFSEAAPPSGDANGLDVPPSRYVRMTFPLREPLRTN